MNRNAVRGWGASSPVTSFGMLALCALFAACGDDDALPPVDTDGGAWLDASADAASDAGADGGAADLGEDAAAVDDLGVVDLGIVDLGTDAAPCVDADGDGYASAACGGDDCDDATARVNPGAVERCNAGVDDDCDGLADAADGVCVPCPMGYRGTFDDDCADVDECVEVSDACTASPRASCMNTPGSYACTCPAGYAGEGRGDGGCADVDECLANTDDCDGAPDACLNTLGGFLCACPAGFSGSGRGAGGCLYDDPSLRSLTVAPGATLSPVFAPETTLYVLSLPPGASATTITPTIAQPEHATITVDGVIVASGAATTVPLGTSFAPRIVTIVVTTETGVTLTYTLTAVRSALFAKASNTGAGDRFGYAVAISADGTTLAVGAISEDSAARGIGGNQASEAADGAGAVYVFRRRDGGAWTQEAYLKASNADAGDNFGADVSLSSDGATLAVGAYGEQSAAVGVGGDATNNAASTAGAVYVFRRSASEDWAEEAYVKASNTGMGDFFGATVALSGDGTTLAVGALQEDSAATGIDGDGASDAAMSSGAVYVYRREILGGWGLEAYVKAANAEAGDSFGRVVALSHDGTTLAVSAYFESSAAVGVGGDATSNAASSSGAAYVFRRLAGVWSQEAYLKASNTGTSDTFGISLSLSADGATLAAGAHWEDSAGTGVDGDGSNNAASNAGAAYVFRRVADAWRHEAYIKASNTGATDFFGRIVALSADGASLVVGAPQEDSDATGLGGDESSNAAVNAGAAYVFRRDVAGRWSQQLYVKASNTGAGDQFGSAIAVSGDGASMVIASSREDSAGVGLTADPTSDAALDSGCVYVY